MEQAFEDWLKETQEKRERWVRASEENDFDRGIWNATVEKYADPGHFIFELLQNAEDVGATWVKFGLEPDRIVFEHDGRPFDRNDIDGITGIGNTTKLDDGHKIGCFGIGFKSVYVVTERPEVHSRIEGRDFGFAIEDLVVPKIVTDVFADDLTHIVLPLRPNQAVATIDRTLANLLRDAPRALLFLHNLKRLEWTSPLDQGSVSVEDQPGGRRCIETVLPNGQTSKESFILLTRKVEEQSGKKHHAVQVALPINTEGELYPEESPSRLCVFFQTEELTGLHFLIHGPFQLTDNRANIKRDDPWNVKLVDIIGDLVADSLTPLRDQGLLKKGALELLPNRLDELPSIFAVIRSKILERFSNEDLIPLYSGGHAAVAGAIRGPGDMRELLGKEGLARFGGAPNRQWILTGLKNTRSETFIESLEISEFGYAEFLTAFQLAFGQQFGPTAIEAQKVALSWFSALSDEDMQKFLLVLDAANRSPRRSISLSNYQFIRLEDGRRHSPNAAVFALDDGSLDPQIEVRDLFLVKNSLIRSGRARGKEVEQFLRRIGVKDVDERTYISAIIRTNYRGAVARPNREKHLQHMRRFIRWWKENREISVFSGVAFLKGGENGEFTIASKLYLGRPYMESAFETVYDGSTPGWEKAALWNGYFRLGKQDLMAFVAACGVEAKLNVVGRTIPWNHPNYGELHRGFDGSRATNTATNQDYYIEGLQQLLQRRDAGISRLVWDAARSAGAGVMTASYSPNQTREANQRRSTLAVELYNAEWIPSKDGSLRRPKNMVAADLEAGFSVGGNESWLRAIGFAEEARLRSDQHRERQKAAQAIGFSPEVADYLQNMSAEARAALSADIMRKIHSHAYDADSFPEKQSRDPQRRANRVAEKAKSAPEKSYAARERTIRTSGMDSKELAKTYLEDHYTNSLGNMICQACHDRMPFRLPSGDFYFEACQFLDTLNTEHAENYLALCPTCSAKWNHANPVTDESLRAAIAEADSPEFQVELAGEPVLLKFTQVHLDDIRTITGIGAQRAP